MPIFSKILVFLFFPTIAFSSVTSQTLHACYLLAKEGHSEESYQALLSAFETRDLNAEFICDQFVKWSTNKDCLMEPDLNKASYFILNKDRKKSVSCIKNGFDSRTKDIHDFSEAFYDWGVSVIDLEKIITSNGKSSGGRNAQKNSFYFNRSNLLSFF